MPPSDPIPDPLDEGDLLDRATAAETATEAHARPAPSQPPPLTTQDLYEKRKGVYPQKIDGPFRRFKWLVMLVTLGIYYATPWIRWDRGAYAPDQAVLVDLAHRRFYMFGI